MNNFLKKNNLNQDLFNKFITFFKQIEHWYTYASIPKNIWHEQWTDHLKHFFYTIISLENPSNEKTIYNHFFSCFEKEAENLYSDISKTRKNLILVGVPSITISLGGLFTFYAWVQTDLEPENLKNSFGGIFCLTSAVLLPTTAASIAVGGYLLNCFGYKKFLKNIKTIDV
ncbi:MAG TPA: hypothetical protein VL201_05520 [Patescibacteria group bacterium]|nr:hypothetical protein [Patescibacteria group bacterium]